MPYSDKTGRAAEAGPPRHTEIVLRADGSRIEMRLWRDAQGPACRIEYLRAGEPVLSYQADGRGCALRGRAAPYAFRSIEQLRYDFERDVEGIDDGDQAPA
jgi:hypothetical protein